MGLQFQSSTCRCLEAAIREVQNAELTQEVRLSDGMPDIGRVLTTWGQVILRSKEWQGNQITVSGGIMTWTLYAPEDGTPPRCLDAWVPFQLKWGLETMGDDGKVRVYPLLRFIDSRSISSRKIMIRAGVAAMAEALQPMQVQIYEPGQLPEDIQILNNIYPVRLPKETGEKSFLLDEDLKIPTGTAVPERLLAYMITPQLQEKRVAGDKVILRGSGKLRVIYRCAEGKIHAAELELPIAQYAQLENTYDSDAVCDVMMGVTAVELAQNDGPELRIRCGLVAQYVITDRHLIKVAEDAYSTKREIGLSIEKLKLPAILEQRVEQIQVHQQVPYGGADVVDINFLPDFPRQNRSVDNVSMEIPGQFQVLYYAPDGILQGAACRWEGNLQLPADGDSALDCLVRMPETIQVACGMEEMHLNCLIKMEITVQSQAGIQMISGLEMGQLETAAPERPSLILRRSNGESLWNMAKRCGSTVDGIMQLNHLKEEPADNQMLLIPVS